MASMTNCARDAARLSETIREALLCLYDPPALAATALAAELIERGLVTSPRSLGEFLRRAIEQLRPLDPAPPWSHGWRCYRYLYLRYVDCQGHAAIAAELGISLRHASRIHQDALLSLARVLLPDRVAGPPASRTGRDSSPRASVPTPGDHTPEPLEIELATVARLPPSGGVDIAELMDGVCQMLRRVAAAHRVDLQWARPARLPPVKGDRVVLRQIALNMLLYLLNLARDRDGEDHRVIVLEAAERGPWVEIAARWLERPGSAALQTASPENQALLAAVRRLARLQEAVLEERGEGAVISDLALRLPASADRTVLLVDDNPDVGELFRQMLAKSPYRLVHARTAGRALSLARELPIDVIVLDVVMPARDGWEILAALQADERTAAIPVIVCSILPDRELALSLGAADFLAKPVTRLALRTALDRLFDSAPVAPARANAV